MKLALISPPGEQAHELATVQALFAAGLERYHLRKPGWDLSRVAAWLGTLPLRWHGRVFLHSHHALAGGLRLGGIHFRDGGETLASARPAGCPTSRSCHDVAAVRAALGRHDAAFFGPVFPSLSKPGYGPAPDSVLVELQAVLLSRGPAEKRTCVFAIGGVTPARLGACQAMGFDGVAILGAVWGVADPVAAFHEFSAACRLRDDAVPPTMEAAT